MPSLPGGEDALRGRQQLLKHKYLCNLAQRQETTWKTTEEGEIPIYMKLCFGGPLWWKSGAQLSPGFHIRQFQGDLGFIGNNIEFEKHLEFAKPNVPSNATSAIACCYGEIILVERWIAAILNRIAHLSTTFPMKPVCRQFKLASSSCTFVKTAAPSLPGINAPNSVYCWIHRVYMNRFCKGFAKTKNLLLSHGYN